MSSFEIERTKGGYKSEIQLYIEEKRRVIQIGRGPILADKMLLHTERRDWKLKRD